MGDGVVQTAKDDILEREAALVGEVILVQQRHHVGDGHRTLGGHQHRTLLMEGGVEADGHMAFALVEEAAQLALYAHAAHGDTLRTPCPSVGGGKDFRSTEHVVEVVHRFSLSHEHDVGEGVALGKGVDLVEDVTGGEVALKPLATGLAEQASHLASHLRRHTERGTLAIGDIDGLHRLPVAGGEEVFHRTVYRALAVGGGHEAHLITLRQFLTVGFRDIGHLVDRSDSVAVQPTGYLPPCERGHTHLHGDLLQFGKRHAYQCLFLTVHCFRLQRYD